MKYFTGRRTRRKGSRSRSASSLTSPGADTQEKPASAGRKAQESQDDEGPMSSDKRTRAVERHDSRSSGHDSELSDRPPSTRTRKRKVPSQGEAEQVGQRSPVSSKKQAVRSGRKNPAKSKAQQQQQQQASRGESQSESELNHSSESSSEEQRSRGSTALSPPEQTNSAPPPGASSHRILDRDFLERQVKLLKTTFELDDCPALLQGRQARKDHIPSHIVQNALRKLNHRVEDNLLCGVNRQAQRTFLQGLHSNVKQAQTVSRRDEEGSLGNMSDDQCTRSEEVTSAVSKMENSLRILRGHLAREKDLLSRATEIATLGKASSDGSFQREIRRTNTLVGQIVENFKVRGTSSCTPPARQSAVTRRSLRQENRVANAERLFTP